VENDSGSTQVNPGKNKGKKMKRRLVIKSHYAKENKWDTWVYEVEPEVAEKILTEHAQFLAEGILLSYEATFAGGICADQIQRSN